MNIGNNVTHILQIKISNDDCSLTERIKDAIHNEIHDRDLVQTVCSRSNIMINWKKMTMPDVSEPLIYYYTDSFHNDTITSGHTRQVLSDMIKKMKNEESYSGVQGYDPNWRITFSITVHVCGAHRWRSCIRF